MLSLESNYKGGKMPDYTNHPNARDELSPVDLGKMISPGDLDKALWASVMLQLIEDYRSNSKRVITFSSYPTARDWRAARAWLKSDRKHAPGSFLAVCDTLDLDPVAVRESLFGK